MKRLWYCTPAELAKSSVKGQWLRLLKPERYAELVGIRPPYHLLVEKKKELLRIVGTELNTRGIKAVNFYARIKSIGSLDRKERYSQVIYPSRASDYVKEDFLGLTVIVRSEAECYRVLEMFSDIGVFPELEYRINPRDYLKNPEKISRPELPAGYRTGVIGNLLLDDFPCLVHTRIFLEAVYSRVLESRGDYKRAVERRIKKSGL